MLKILKARNELTRSEHFFHYQEENVFEDVVRAFPVGGGFEYTIPIDDVIDWDTDMPNDIIKITVGFDSIDCGIYTAFIYENSNWNGWLCPLLPREEVEKFVKKQTDLGGMKEGFPEFKWEGDNIIMLADGDIFDEEIIIEPSTIMYEGEEVKVWDVALGLIWQEWTEEELKGEGYE